MFAFSKHSRSYCFAGFCFCAYKDFTDSSSTSLACDLMIWPAALTKRLLSPQIETCDMDRLHDAGFANHRQGPVKSDKICKSTMIVRPIWIVIQWTQPLHISCAQLAFQRFTAMFGVFGLSAWSLICDKTERPERMCCRRGWDWKCTVPVMPSKKINMLKTGEIEIIWRVCRMPLWVSQRKTFF